MRIKSNDWLLTVPIAHRGLWGNEIQENSIPAFINAAQNGFAIETDLYSTLDGEIVCFHDQNLLRLTGVNKNIYELALKEIKTLSINGGKEKIPTLKEVLSAVDGKTPLLIEFKDQPNKNYVDSAVKILKNYSGKFAVQSFNPFILKKIKKLAPDFLRGILSSNIPDVKSKIKHFVVKKMPFNFLCKPDFISYEYSGLPLKKSVKKNRPVLAWTVESKEIQNKIKTYCDNIIFEKFIP